MTLHGLSKSLKASVGAVNSIWLLVQLMLPPQSSFVKTRVFSLPLQKAPQPPGPGFPLLAPSVQISTRSFSCSILFLYRLFVAFDAGFSSRKNNSSFNTFPTKTPRLTVFTALRAQNKEPHCGHHRSPAFSIQAECRTHLFVLYHPYLPNAPRSTLKDKSCSQSLI